MAVVATDDRIEQFEQHKSEGRQMVHRLREWEAGDVLFGVETVTDGASSGKTFQRGSETNVQAFEKASKMFADEPKLGELDEDSVVYLYVADIRTVSTDPRDPADPGEPPLKHASLENVRVLTAKTGGDE